VISYNTVVSACARANEPEKAEAAFHMMVTAGLSPSAISYSTVIHAHAHAGNARKAQAWLDRMDRDGIVGDSIPYNSVCAAHARRGDVASALATFHAMRRKGVEASAQTHATMIHAFVQAGNAEQAELSLRALMEAGEPLDAASFNSLISLYAKASAPHRAEAVLILMGQCHPPVRPSLVTFNSLASAHAAVGDVEAVERTLQTAARAPFHFAWDRYSYGALLRVLVKARGGRRGGVERARAAVLAMWDGGVRENEFLSKLAASALGGAKQLEALRAEHCGRGRERPSNGSTAPLRATPPPTEDAFPASRSSLAGATLEGAQPADEDDGWVVATKRSTRHSGRSAAADRAYARHERKPASKTIQKPKQASPCVQDVPATRRPVATSVCCACTLTQHAGVHPLVAAGHAIA
jgi:pentatricopeptide repeat protein